MYVLKKLNPRVVDLAIDLIKSGKSHYTCIALKEAAKAFHKKGPYPAIQYKDQHSRVHRIEILKFATCRGTWWNSRRACKESRIKALEKTKAEIIKNNSQ